MKQRIKDFLFKKRIKILRSKKGFSLIEVLVAVAIIGIISAIAVPQFTAQRNTAAKVAVDTSAGNVAKAFKNCVALNAFSACDTLAEIKVSCPAGATCDSGGASSTFCAHIHKGQAGDNDFKVCVSIDGNGNELRSYGGDLLTSVASSTVCHTAKTASTDNTSCAAVSASPDPGLKACTSGNIGTVCGGNTPAGTTTCGIVRSCTQVTTVGNCDNSTGLCS